MLLSLPSLILTRHLGELQSRRVIIDISSLKYQGIPVSAEVAVPVATNTNEADMTGSSPLSGVPNSSPLNMFPQVKYHTLLVGLCFLCASL